MKKLSFIVLFLMSFVLLFCNCGSDNDSDTDLDNPTNSFVGRWHLVKTVQEFSNDSPIYAGQSITLDARDLGTYWDITETSVTIHSPKDKEYDGKTFSYQLNGNIVTVVGEDQYEVVKVSTHEMILKTVAQRGYSSLYTYWEK